MGTTRFRNSMDDIVNLRRKGSKAFFQIGDEKNVKMMR